MRRGSLQRSVGLPIAAVATVSLLACTRTPQEVAAEHGAVVSKYCSDCHSVAEQEGGLVLERPNLVDPAAQRAKWEKVIHKLSAGLMPPPGEPRPSGEAVASLVSYLATSLDATAARPSAG
jgi:mono/diheme cytochrome c family protein